MCALHSCPRAKFGSVFHPIQPPRTYIRSKREPCCWWLARKKCGLQPSPGLIGRLSDGGAVDLSGCSTIRRKIKRTTINAQAQRKPMASEEELMHNGYSNLAPFSGIDQYFKDLEAEASSGEEELMDEPELNPGAKKRGRKKGFSMDPEHKRKIREALKGKNTYKRSNTHNKKIAAAMKRSWQKRRESGKPARVASVRCGLCGKMGHNRRTCPLAEKKGELSRTMRLCGYCGQPGHTRRKCPTMKADLKMLQRERLKDTKQKKQLVTTMSSKISDKVSFAGVEKAMKVIKGPIPVPKGSKDIWEQALGAALRAWKDGVKRQRMEVMLPMLKVSAGMDPSMGWPGGIKQQFKVAVPLVEAVLKGLKSLDGLDGRLDPKLLNDVDIVASWKSKKIVAVLFPQPDSVDTLLALGTKDGSGSPELMLMVNPQWQPGQVISDFGFGVLREIREDFVGTFQEVFFMKRISVFSDVVIILRCYPFDWQVHLASPSGELSLLGTTRSKPSFAEIQGMLKNTPGAMASLNWIDKLQQQYTPALPMRSMESRRKSEPDKLMRKGDLVDQASLESFGRQDLPPDGFIPNSKELEMWGESMNSVDVSRVMMKNAILNELDNAGDGFDIVTGKPVRDLMRDPVTQFRSLFDVFGSEDDKLDSEGES